MLSRNMLSQVAATQILECRVNEMIEMEASGVDLHIILSSSVKPLRIAKTATT